MVTTESKKLIDLSVVVPVYNEEESVEPLYNKITDALRPLSLNYEIVLVDDGSKDATFQKAAEIAKRDKRLVVVKLKRNYGQTIGLHAGFHTAQGKLIVTMDGDLQNDPDDIKNMLAELNKGYDIVLGWRHERKDFFISRKLPSKIANWIISRLTGVPVKDNGCAIRAYRAEIVKKFPMYSEMHRLMPVITAMSGAKFNQITVKHHPRQFGQSKYGISRVYKVIIDMVALKVIFAFFSQPLYGFGTFAAFFGLISMFFLSFGLIHLIIYNDMSILTIMGAAILLGSLGAFLIFLGVISEFSYKTGNIKIDKLLKSKLLKTNDRQD
jgi:glycosyltransferase involved in cell wall biosynthesis